jgi:hypothetical protein
MMKLRDVRVPWLGRVSAAAAAALIAVGCETPSANTFSRNFALRPDVPIDAPEACPPDHCDDCTNGGRLFKMYCGSCHNARPMGERPFSNYEVAISHMRDQAYLTGKEYRQIIHFFRRWHDIGPATPPVEPSPKRLTFSQPIPELEPGTPAAGAPAGTAAPSAPSASAGRPPGANAAGPAVPLR